MASCHHPRSGSSPQGRYPPVDCHDQPTPLAAASKCFEGFGIRIAGLCHHVRTGIAWVYRLANFFLPEASMDRLAAVVGDPAAQTDCVWSFIEVWKKISVVSGILLPMIVGIQQIPGIGTGIGVQMTVFVSFACTSVSFATSCLLLSTMGRRTGHGTSGGSRAGAAERVTNDSEPRRNGFHPLWTVALESTRPVGGVWNIHVMIALPATWMVWSVIIFFNFLVLALWSGGGDVDPAAGSVTVLVSIARKSLIPKAAATIVLLIGAVHIALIIRELQARATHMSGL